MKIKYHTYLLIALTCFLSACSSKKVTKTPSVNVSKTTPSPTDNYRDKKKTSLTGTTIISSNNQCIDHFRFLQEAKSNKYPEYTLSYGRIGTGYKFLNTNKEIMDVDARKVYTMALDSKVDTLCEKVKYTGYLLVKEKIKELI